MLSLCQEFLYIKTTNAVLFLVSLSVREVMPNTRRKITARNLGQKVCDEARFAPRSRAAIFSSPAGFLLLFMFYFNSFYHFPLPGKTKK